MCLKIVTQTLHVTKNVFVYEIAVHISLTLLYLNDKNGIVYPIVLNSTCISIFDGMFSLFTYGLKYAEMSTV